MVGKKSARPHKQNQNPLAVRKQGFKKQIPTVSLLLVSKGIVREETLVGETRLPRVQEVLNRKWNQGDGGKNGEPQREQAKRENGELFLQGEKWGGLKA